MQEKRLPILKFSQDNPQNNFLNFLTSKNIFITLQYSGDIIEIFLKKTFLECSPNILETLFRDYWNLPKDQHLPLSNHTFLTKKQLFHQEPLMSPKCSLDVPNIATLREHTANIPGILRAGWLICEIKKEHIIHINNLKQVLSHRFALKNIHKVIKFNQKAWLKSYVDMNIELRKKKAKIDFEKDFFKLINNSAFRKRKKYQDIRLVTAEKRISYNIVFSKNLIAIEMKKHKYSKISLSI